MKPLRLAFVVQRYGADVNGGAEQLCRTLVRRLVRRPEVGSLAVFTTCARDHLTWANHYAPGVTDDDGVRLERFAVQGRRWPRLQKYIFDAMTGLKLPALEPLWLRAQGPFAPGLLARIAEAREAFDAFVFVTYLYHPTVRGLPLVRERAVLLSTAHDEPAIGAPGFASLFAAPRAIACLTPEEREFLIARFGLAPERLVVVGSGLDAPPAAAAIDAAADVVPARSYVLYVGRIESEKGVPELIEGFRAFKAAHADATFRADDGRAFRGEDLALVLAGRPGMPLPSTPDVIAPGFVSDAAKHALLRGALAVVAPSRYESLSLALLEAWQHGRPALANARCSVTAGQMARAGGGAAYEGADGFAAALATTLRDPVGRAVRGAAGRAWAESEVSWPAVEARWLELLAAVVS